MKLLRINKKKIIKNKNAKNLHNLEINEVVLVRCNIVHNNYQ